MRGRKGKGRDRKRRNICVMREERKERREGNESTAREITRLFMCLSAPLFIDPKPHVKKCGAPRNFPSVCKDSTIYFSSVSASDENLCFTVFLLLNFRGGSEVFRACPLPSFPHLSSLTESIYTFAPRFSAQLKCLAHPATPYHYYLPPR